LHREEFAWPPMLPPTPVRSYLRDVFAYDKRPRTISPITALRGGLFPGP
jgi:hypothetical protein